MGSHRSRRHHYIPEMLLKNFCDDDGQLWVNDRTVGKIYPSTPKNVFVRRDLNTSYDFPSAPRSDKEEEFFDSIEASDEYEQILSRLEGEADSVVQKVIKQARDLQCLQLSSEDRNTLKRFILAMARRTPESQRRITPDKSFDEIFYNAATAIAKKDNYRGLPEKAAFYQDPRIAKLKAMTGANVVARFAAGAHPRERKVEEQFCHETGLGIMVICMPKRAFVIGSHGLAIVRRSQGNAPTRESWLPIAHDVAVGPTSFPDREFLLPLDRSRDGTIRSINSASAAQSQIIAGRSEALVRAFKEKF